MQDYDDYSSRSSSSKKKKSKVSVGAIVSAVSTAVAILGGIIAMGKDSLEIIDKLSPSDKATVAESSVNAMPSEVGSKGLVETDSNASAETAGVTGQNNEAEAGASAGDVTGHNNEGQTVQTGSDSSAPIQPVATATVAPTATLEPTPTAALMATPVPTTVATPTPAPVIKPQATPTPVPVKNDVTPPPAGTLYAGSYEPKTFVTEWLFDAKVYDLVKTSRGVLFYLEGTVSGYYLKNSAGWQYCLNDIVSSSVAGAASLLYYPAKDEVYLVVGKYIIRFDDELNGTIVMTNENKTSTKARNKTYSDNVQSFMINDTRMYVGGWNCIVDISSWTVVKEIKNVNGGYAGNMCKIETEYSTITYYDMADVETAKKTLTIAQGLESKKVRSVYSDIRFCLADGGVYLLAHEKGIIYFFDGASDNVREVGTYNPISRSSIKGFYKYGDEFFLVRQEGDVFVIHEETDKNDHTRNQTNLYTENYAPVTFTTEWLFDAKVYDLVKTSRGVLFYLEGTGSGYYLKNSSGWQYCLNDIVASSVADDASLLYYPAKDEVYLVVGKYIIRFDDELNGTIVMTNENKTSTKARNKTYSDNVQSFMINDTRMYVGGWNCIVDISSWTVVKEIKNVNGGYAGNMCKIETEYSTITYYDMADVETEKKTLTIAQGLESKKVRSVYSDIRFCLADGGVYLLAHEKGIIYFFDGASDNVREVGTYNPISRSSIKGFYKYGDEFFLVRQEGDVYSIKQ